MFTFIKNGVKAIGQRFMRAIGATPPPKPPMSEANKAVLQWAGKEGAEGGAQAMQAEIARQAARQGKDASWWKPSGKTLVSIGISVGVGLLLPGVGWAGQVVVSALVETGGEAAVGVLSAPAPASTPEPTPEPTEAPPPVRVVEEAPPPAPQHTEQPQNTPAVVIIQSTPHPDDNVDVETPEPSDEHETTPTEDPHGGDGCCGDEMPHEP